jgi:hypothetical protein
MRTWTVILNVDHTYEIDANTEEAAIEAAESKLASGQQGDSSEVMDSSADVFDDDGDQEDD